MRAKKNGVAWNVMLAKTEAAEESLGTLIGSVEIFPIIQELVQEVETSAFHTNETESVHHSALEDENSPNSTPSLESADEIDSELDEEILSCEAEDSDANIEVSPVRSVTPTIDPEQHFDNDSQGGAWD
jgi:hypothetical protein